MPNHPVLANWLLLAILIVLLVALFAGWDLNV